MYIYLFVFLVNLFVMYILVKGRYSQDRLRGSTGIQGVKGIQGEQGIRGNRGPKGRRGVQGVQGDKGPQGNNIVCDEDFVRNKVSRCLDPGQKWEDMNFTTWYLRDKGCLFGYERSSDGRKCTPKSPYNTEEYRGKCEYNFDSLRNYSGNNFNNWRNIIWERGCPGIPGPKVTVSKSYPNGSYVQSIMNKRFTSSSIPGYADITKDNSTKCAERCLKIPSCAGFTYDKTSKSCSVKNIATKNNIRDSNGHISGYKVIQTNQLPIHRTSCPTTGSCNNKHDTCEGTAKNPGNICLNRSNTAQNCTSGNNIKTYSKHTNKFVQSGYGGHYGNEEKAKIQCNNDPNCAGFTHFTGARYTQLYRAGSTMIDKTSGWGSPYNVYKKNVTNNYCWHRANRTQDISDPLSEN